MSGLKKSYDVEVEVLTDERYGSGIIDDVPFKGVPHTDREEALDQTITRFRPDVIFTQLMWSDVAMVAAKRHDVPSVLRVCKIPFETDICEGSHFSPTEIIVVSEPVRDYVKEKFGRSSYAVPSAVDLDILRSHFRPGHGRYIMMFNPLERKGGNIFRMLAATMPDHEFATVLGWSTLKNEPGSAQFSDAYIRRITESLGSVYTNNPKFVDMSDLANVTYLDPSPEVWKIYEQVKVLLVPSQWQETFGRVALEGLALGIPTVASGVGGLAEIVGNAGIVVSDYELVSVWRECLLKAVKDPARYSESGKTRARQYSLDNVLKAHQEVLMEAIR
ncbi:MAG: glycosyltransferase family 4 protein [Pirellulales bacterium]